MAAASRLPARAADQPECHPDERHPAHRGADRRRLGAVWRRRDRRVVNFVLKRNYQGGEITARADVPLEGGGKSASASITYGLGDLDSDRFSIVGTYRATSNVSSRHDRDFGQTAYVPFELNGTKYVYDRTSTFAVPANATVTFTGGLPSYSFNPYQKANGKCADRNYLSLNNAATPPRSPRTAPSTSSARSKSSPSLCATPCTYGPGTPGQPGHAVQ